MLGYQGSWYIIQCICYKTVLLLCTTVIFMYNIMFLTASRLDMYWLNVQTLCLSLCFLYVHDLCDNKHFWIWIWIWIWIWWVSLWKCMALFLDDDRSVLVHSCWVWLCIKFPRIFISTLCIKTMNEWTVWYKTKFGSQNFGYQNW